MTTETDLSDMQDAKKEIINLIAQEPRLGHELLFEHRHPNETPEFHGDIIDVWHDHTKDRISIQAFRGGAKSTVGCEEATIIMALLGVFKNGLIIGEKYERAVERLDAIKHEIENNEKIHDIFGDCQGKIWKEGKIELMNGTVIQAIGRGQSMRGAKHRDQRPDYCVGDDIEDMDSVRTEESKKATLSWFMSVVIPALDKNKHLIRIIGTPLETDSLMEKLGEDEGWYSMKIPIEYYDEDGERQATWADRFSLEDIDKIKSDFERMGLLLEFGREYMCEARSAATREFTQEMMKVEPIVRDWHAVYVMYDPARTKKDSSDHYGKAVWSWIGNELRIWEASGHLWRTYEMIDDLFETNEKYNPVVIGVEETGLNDWLMDPIRHEVTKRNLLLPIRPMNAPKGEKKKDFILGLQPFFKAGEVIMNQEWPDLVTQLLNHPIGRDDVPNALAFAPVMRPGLPVYEDFCRDHILYDYVQPKTKVAAAINYEAGVVSAAFFQKGRGGVVVIGDCILEGEPQQMAKDILEYGYYVAGGHQKLDVFVHPAHYTKYSASGLIGALRKEGADPRQAGDITKGRGYIVDSLRQRRSGVPAFRVSSEAKYVLNGMVAGYCFEFDPKGRKGLSDRAREGLYRTLMEGLECSMAVYTSALSDEDNTLNYRVDKSGRRYLSTLPK